MALYKTQEEEDEINQDPVYVRQHMHRYGRVIRYSQFRKPWKIPEAQRVGIDVLTEVARRWSNDLTPALRLEWGTAKNALTARDGEAISMNRYTRFVQVQCPLLRAGKPRELTRTQRNQTQIRSLQILDYSVEQQVVQVGWEWRRSGLTVERVCINVAQVPEDYIGRDHLWKYANWIGSFDQLIQLTLDIWYPVFAWFPFKFPIHSGGEFQLYIRINNFRNDNPPATTQLSTESTEDWTAFIQSVA